MFCAYVLDAPLVKYVKSDGSTGLRFPKIRLPLTRSSTLWGINDQKLKFPLISRLLRDSANVLEIESVQGEYFLFFLKMTCVRFTCGNRAPQINFGLKYKSAVEQAQVHTFFKIKNNVCTAPQE